jgi:AcrR family transcriptional regulator
MPRPRTPEDPILRATVDLLAEHGIGGLTVDTVAATTGVSKATLYRRWGSRAQLIHAAISSMQQPFVEPDSGSLREDLVLLLRQLVAYVSRRDSGRLLPALVDAAARDPELAVLQRQTAQAARAVYERVLRRGIDRGELPADVDTALVIDLLMGPVLYRRHTMQNTVRGSYADAVIDTVLAAFSRVPT